LLEDEEHSIRPAASWNEENVDKVCTIDDYYCAQTLGLGQ
jgi:hypothetical protein